MCDRKGCTVTEDFLIASLDDRTIRLQLCPNHQLEYLINKKEMELEKTSPSQMTDETCEVCGDAAGLFEDEQAKLHLCQTHLDKLIGRSLEPNAFKTLFKKYGDIFLLHDDFYEPFTGEALQPFN